MSKTIQIKFKDGRRIVKPRQYGDWIDLELFKDEVFFEGEFKVLDLGVAMKLPKGYEAHIAARSSTFEKYGLIQTNGLGIIDNGYCGDNDWWGFPALATRVVRIKAGTRICQFRIVKVQPKIVFEAVDKLNDINRGGFGSSGR